MKQLNTKNLTNKWWFKLTITIFGIILVFALWLIISAIVSNEALFPSPIKVIPVFISFLGNINIYAAIGMTLLRLLISILISLLLALILGVIGGLVPTFHRLINPLVIVLRTIPTAAVILILIVLLKPVFALTIIVCLVTFPVLYEAVRGGIANTDESIKQSLKLETSLSNHKSIFKVLLPCSAPYIFLGIIQTIGLGMKVSIMSEVLVGNPNVNGLGMMIKNYYTYLEMDKVLAVSMYAIILIGLVDLLLSIVKKKINH